MLYYNQCYRSLANVILFTETESSQSSKQNIGKYIMNINEICHRKLNIPVCDNESGFYMFLHSFTQYHWEVLQTDNCQKIDDTFEV